MPRRCLAGTFEGKPAYRWRKMVKGKYVTLLCRKRKPDEKAKEGVWWLGLPEQDWTKERSMPAANKWWKERFPEIEAKEREDKEQAFTQMLRTVDSDDSNQLADHLQDLELKIKWASKNDPVLHNRLLAVKQKNLDQPAWEAQIYHDDEDVYAKRVEALELLGPEAVRPFLGSGAVWSERLRNFTEPEETLTIRSQITKFLMEVGGGLEQVSFKELQQCLQRLSEHLGDDFDCSTIDEKLVSSHFLWLAEMKLQNVTKKKRLGFFRRFVTWLWSSRVLAELPRNLSLRTHRFEATCKKVDLPPFSEVKPELERLPEKQRLWALLGLNCGVTQSDLGALTWAQVDLSRGTLTRKRVKTKSHPNVPVVTYKLFPETLELLKKLPRKGSLVFTTNAGGPMYRQSLERTPSGLLDGKKIDEFTNQWRRLHPKPAIKLKIYKKIAASAFNLNANYRGFDKYFLGHAPTEVKDKHYSVESDEVFFEALDFVHGVLFGE